MIKKTRITYKENIDKHGISVYYFIDIYSGDEIVKWYFHPRLPEGMHWKKGDETGLGFDHDNGEQSFEEFLNKPKHHIPDKHLLEATKIIGKYEEKA